MSSNCLVFHTSGGISSNPAVFLFLISLNESSSSCVNCPSLMSNCLLILLVIGSCITFGGFPGKFLKCCFHSCIRSSWLACFQFSFHSAIPSANFVYCLPCYPGLSVFNRVSNLIDLILYAFCSFRYTLANSFCAFLSFWALILVGFHLLHLEAVFMSARFFLSANVFHETLGLALCLVGMHSAAASWWTLTKFSYSSFGVGVSDFSCSASTLYGKTTIHCTITSGSPCLHV